MMGMRTYAIAAVIVAICQSLAIAGMLATHNQMLTTGKEVVIQSAFVDPRSLFRGHYVIINLRPGDLTKSAIESDGPFKPRETVFVELVRQEGIYWVAKKLWRSVPKATTNPVIKGTMMWDPKTDSQPYRIRFPFDRYFAPRTRAKALEKIQAGQKLGVVLSLQDDGTGLIKGLMVDGQLVYDESVF